MQDIVSKVKSTIYGHGRGWCFTPNDFIAFGSDLAVRKALSRLQEKGFIRRLSWGLYEYPRKHAKLGLLPANIEQVVKAIGRKDGTKALPSGAYAANLLGLSPQVPAKVVYLTEGLSKRIRIDRREIILKKTTPKNIATANSVAGLIIQAFKHLGRNNVDQQTLAKLKKRLSAEDIQSLKKHLKFAPVWIKKIMISLMEISANG